MLEITEYHLDKNNYIQTATKKEYIFIHHTAGWDNPYRVIDDWRSDARGRIATKYVIGGPSIKSGVKSYNGVVLEAFPGEGYAYHLGDVNSTMHKNSLGIELCNFGYLTKNGVNYYTYTGTIVPRAQVCDLGFKFRGYQYYHMYGDQQLESLRILIIKLSSEHNINMGVGLVERLATSTPTMAFGFDKSAKEGKIKGILSHTNVRTDKFDVSPQPNLIQMLKNLV